MLPIHATFSSGSATPGDAVVLQRLRLRGDPPERRRVADVHSELEFNLAAFRDDGGRCIVIVSLDLLYIGEALPRLVESRLAERLDLASTTFVWCASHTHYAPAVDDRIRSLGGADSAYVDALADRLGAALAALLKSGGEPVTVAHRRIANSYAVQRRKRYRLPTLRWLKAGRDEIYMAPNPGGVTSRGIDLVVFRDRNGAARAVLWAMACHPTTFPGSDRVSSEFPGAVRAAIRKEFAQPDLPVLFMQGFSGDQRAYLPHLAKRAGLLDKAARLLTGPRFPQAGLADWEGWSGGLAADVCGALGAMPEGRPCMGAVLAHRKARPLEDFVAEAAPGFAVDVCGVRIGDGLNIVAVSAEMSCAYERKLHEDTIAVGCAGACVGYIPTDAQAIEGGYEGGRALSIFATGKRFLPSLETRMSQMLESVESRLRADDPRRTDPDGNGR